MTDLRPAEIEDAEFSFQIYMDAENKLDGTLLGKWLYTLNQNPSLDQIEKLGGSKKKGEKKLTFQECLPIYSQVKKEKKDHGCYEDFIECLKLYDKNENGKMPVGELSHSLGALGEKLHDDEVDEVFEDCMDEEDDEGDIPYTPFLRRMCGLDPPLKPAKKK